MASKIAVSLLFILAIINIIRLIQFIFQILLCILAVFIVDKLVARCYKAEDILLEQIGRHLKILIGIEPRERGRKAGYYDMGR